MSRVDILCKIVKQLLARDVSIFPHFIKLSYFIVMISSWNFPSWAKPSWKGSEPITILQGTL